MPLGYELDENAFLEEFSVCIETHAKQSAQHILRDTWQKFSGASTPSEWAINAQLPVRFVLGEISESGDIISAVEHPENFTSERLNQLIEVLKNHSPVRIAQCQQNFMNETVPNKFARLDINLASLLTYLDGAFGSQPNTWPIKPNINTFIHGQYRNTFAPQVAEKIRLTPPEKLKEDLLQLVRNNPDLGLAFWE